jgi:hypothetical protein
MVLVAAAGPGMNIALALIAAMPFFLVGWLGPSDDLGLYLGGRRPEQILAAIIHDVTRFLDVC